MPSGPNASGPMDESVGPTRTGATAPSVTLTDEDATTNAAKSASFSEMRMNHSPSKRRIPGCREWNIRTPDVLERNLEPRRAGRKLLRSVEGPFFRPAETMEPYTQRTPVPPRPQYPPGFFARYCWW